MKGIAHGILFIVLSAVVVHAQVTRKEMIAPDGTVEHIFFSGGKERARQTLDDSGNILQTIGTIPDGVVKGYYESGTVEYACTYRDNKLEGTVTVYYESGKVMDNKRNGITNWYYESGGLMRQFDYKDGKLDGVSKKFYENGVLWSTKTYRDGKFIARKEYDKNGKLQTEWHYPIEKQEGHYEKRPYEGKGQ
jgi:antitoxin component YwqK of YwqJK toxin-antitoxin module